jgi:hypothetical protein
MKKITIAIAIFTVMAFAATGAFAATKLTVANATGKTGISVPITVSDPVGIAGVAFTLDYDTTKLSVTDVKSDFFGTFTAMGYSGDDVGLEAGTVDGYEKPLVVNPATGGKITKIAAARPTAGTAADGTTLFTLTVDVVDTTAAAGATFPITIKATTLNNTAAGYSADGEEIDLLIKEDYTPALSKTDATAAGNITAGTITVAEDFHPGEPIAPYDGKTSLLDLSKALELYKSSKTQSLDTTNVQYKSCDVVDPKGNGKIDLLDLSEMLKLYKASKRSDQFAERGALKSYM